MRTALRSNALHRRGGQVVLALPPDPALVFRSERREANPVVAAHEEQQKRHSQVVEGLDREDHHRQEERARQYFGIGEPPVY